MRLIHAQLLAALKAAAERLRNNDPYELRRTMSVGDIERCVATAFDDLRQELQKEFDADNAS